MNRYKCTPFILASLVFFTAIVLTIAACGTSTSVQPPPMITVEKAAQPIISPSESPLAYPTYYITIMGQGEDITVYIIDPLGRHLGVNPLSRETVNEIPGADFEDNPVWGDEAAKGDPIVEPPRLIVAHIEYPVEGIYRVQVHGMLGEQGGGLGLSARHNGNIKAERLVAIDPAQELPIEYQFTYSLGNEELVTELLLTENDK